LKRKKRASWFGALELKVSMDFADTKCPYEWDYVLRVGAYKVKYLGACVYQVASGSVR